MSDFVLHPKLAADSIEVLVLQICQVRLSNDTRFPWLILVPALPGLRDWHDVPATHQATVLDEVNRTSIELMRLTNADKMNVAALGNQVPQLHIHVIARHENDAAWPNPVWGAGAALPYADKAATELIGSLKQALS